MTALAAIHVAKKQLGLDDESYRAVLKRVTGKSSSAEMDEAERQRVVEEMRRLGFTKKKPAKSGRPAGPYAAKLQALWIAGWNLGIVRDRRDAALTAFVKRQTGLDHTRFLRYPEDASKAIEALKGWLSREGGVDWAVDRRRPAHQWEAGFKIAWAQWKELYDEPDRWLRFRYEVDRLTGRNPDEARSEDWIKVMNALGERIRENK